MDTLKTMNMINACICSRALMVKTVAVKKSDEYDMHVYVAKR